MTFSPEEDLELAHQLADVADKQSMARYRASDLRVETKPDLTPVTEADKAVEQLIRTMLSAARPDDGVVGEEFGGDGELDDEFDDEFEGVTRPHLPTEPCPVEPAEQRQLPGEPLVVEHGVGAHLGDRLAHQHARHERHGGKVAPDPELVAGHVLVADAQAPGLVLVDDGRELLHLETLRIVLPDIFQICDHMIEIQSRRVNDIVARRH